MAMMGGELVTTAEARSVLPQSRFRSSLTATVIIRAVPGDGKTSPDRAGQTPSLGCREVALRWADLPGAKRYVVYVAGQSTGPWKELPPANVCGSVHAAGTTALVDVEPTTGAPTVAHRLYYKVGAFPSIAATGDPIDVAGPIAVSLPDSLRDRPLFPSRDRLIATMVPRPFRSFPIHQEL
jgi:hypothetical protein